MQRRRDPGVIEALFEEPHRFGFFQTVRLLERWFAAQGARTGAASGSPGDARGAGGDIVARHLRFRNHADLGFPPSELAAAVAYDAAGQPLREPQAGARALAQDKAGRVELTPTFFGLLGAQGALPLHYTEALAAHESLRRDDEGVRAFFDIFSNRAAALFYAAWKKYRLPLRHETEADHHYLPLLLALGGIGHPTLRHRLRTGAGRVHDEAIAHYAAAARQRPMSAAFLRQLLSDYFGVPIVLEQFVGRWYHVPEEHRTRLGAPGAQLGVSAHAGERIWQRDLRLRLRVGPLREREFADFLPGGESAAALEKLLTLFCGITFEYEVRLVLRREDIAGSALGGTGGARLGWNSFLCTRPPPADRDDANYELHTIH